MPLTADFHETVRERAAHDPAFRDGLLTEAVECFLAGETEAGKILLRDYVEATIGFRQLATLIDKRPESLMRMLSPKGNPQARNLFEVIAHLQRHEGLHFQVRATR